MAAARPSLFQWDEMTAGGHVDEGDVVPALDHPRRVQRGEDRAVFAADEQRLLLDAAPRFQWSSPGTATTEQCRIDLLLEPAGAGAGRAPAAARHTGTR